MRPQRLLVDFDSEARTGRKAEHPIAQLALDGQIDLAGMVSRTIALEGVMDAFEDMKNGNVIRSVVTL